LYGLFLAPQKLPKIVTVHGYAAEEAVSQGLISRGSPMWIIMKWIERRITRRFDRIICVDSRLRSRLVENHGSSVSDRSVVIMNGVDLAPFNAVRRGSDSLLGSQNFSQERTLRVLNAKAMVPKNGQEYLIRSFSRVIHEVPYARLLLVGDGRERRSLEELVQKIGLKKYVWFGGELPNSRIPEIISGVDVVCIPSVRVEDVEEASSIFLLEAMASEKPVIASNIGGLAESIVDGMTGILVPDRNPDAIADAILDLHRSPQKARSIAQAAKHYVATQRSWQQVALRHKQLYWELAFPQQSA